jgi:hypothetical protein
VANLTAYRVAFLVAAAIAFLGALAALTIHDEDAASTRPGHEADGDHEAARGHGHGAHEGPETHVLRAHGHGVHEANGDTADDRATVPAEPGRSQPDPEPAPNP